VKTALELLKNNEQFAINELVVDMKKKYPTFDQIIYQEAIIYQLV